MSTLELKIDDSAANRRLNALISSLSGKRQLMAGIAQELLAKTERNFQQQGQQGAKWPALAPSTQKARARKGHGATSPILRGRRPNLVRNFTLEFSDQFAAIKNPVKFRTIR